MAADFVVAAEVKTAGAVTGAKALASETSKLTDSSRKLGEENRRLKTSSQELEQAERRRIGLAADMVRSVKAQISALAEYQRTLVATRSAEAARAAMASRISVSSIGVDPSGKLGTALQALMEKERQLRASVQDTAEEIARAERVAANVAGLQARTREMQEALVAAQQGVNAERAYAEALEARKAVEASGAAPGTSQAAAVEKEVAAQRELTAQLGAVARARERDEDAAREENAQRDRVAGEIARLRETTSQLELLAAAHRRGAKAVREANLQIEVRNALLRNGVAAGSLEAATIERQIRAQERLRQEINQSVAAKARATHGVFSLRNAFFALQGVLATLGLAALIRESVGVALALDRAQKALVAVSGSQMVAGQEMAFVRGEADRLGLVLASTAQSYASLTAASKGTTLQGQPTREIFSAVSEAAVVLGLSADQSQGALLSLQQMMSKGTVQAEELRGQLGERLPGAFQIAARAMGVTTAELGKMLEGGEVMAADLLPKLAVELRKTFGPGLALAVTSAQANLNRLTNDLNDLKAALGRGFLEGFLQGFTQLRRTLTDAEIQQAAKNIGETLGSAMRLAAEGAAWLASNLDLVKSALIALALFKTIQYFMTLASVIREAGGALAFFRARLLSTNAPLAAISLALGYIINGLIEYRERQLDAAAAERERLRMKDETLTYLNQLKINTKGLVQAERDLAAAIHNTLQARLAAVKSELASKRAFYSVGGRAGFYSDPKDVAAAVERRPEVQALANQAKELQSELDQLMVEWTRLAKLPPLDPIASGADEKAGKLAAKLADLLEGFRRTAEQAERIARANLEGAIPARDATDAIERENAAYQALNSIEGLSAASKRKLSAVIGELVGRTQDANRASEEAIAIRERDLAYNNSALEAEARLQDVKAGSTEASRQLAAVLEAEAIARAKFSTDDPRYSALVNALTGEIRLRADYLVSIQQRIEAEGRLTAHQEELASLEAQLTDLIEGSTAATRANTAAVAAATIIKGLSTEEAERSAEAIKKETAARAEEVRALTAQIAAEERLQAQQGEISSLKAVIADYAEQAEAAREYGSEVAQILQQYGLLNSATRELVIQEQILAAVREEGLDRSDFWHRMRILEIEDEIRAHAEMVDSLNAYLAAADLARYVNEPINDAWRQTGEVIKSSVVDVLFAAFGQAEFNFKDFLRNLLRMWAQAMVEMFARWLATQKAMAATNIATGQGGTGGWLSMLRGLGGGGGGAMFGTAAQTASVGAMGTDALALDAAMGVGTGGSSAWATASSFAWVIPVAIGLYAIYKGFIEKGVEWAEASTRGARSGNDRKVKETVSRRIQELIKEVEAFAKAMQIPYEKIGDVTIGKRGRLYYVKDAMDSFGRAFDSAEAAMDYARVRAIQLAEYGEEVTRLVLAAIKGSRATTTAQLQNDIERARELESIGKPEGQANLDAAIDLYRERVAWIIDIYRNDLVAMNEALAQAGQGLILSLQAMRDQITGRQKTPKEEAEEKARQVAMFNATLVLLRAELEAKKLDLLARAASIRAIIAHGGALIGHAGIVIGVTDVIMKAAGSSLALLEAQAAALEAQAAAIDEMLRNLPKPINPNDYDEDGIPNDRDKTPWGGPRAGGGAGRNRQDEREDLRREIGAMGLTDVGSAIRNARQGFDDLKERIRAAGFSSAEAAKLIAAAGAELERQIAEIKNNVLRDVEAFKNAGTVRGGSLLSGIAGIGATAQKLIKDLEALREAGVLTGREFRVARREIEAAARRQKEALVTQAATSLLSDLYSLLGMDKEAAQLKYDLSVLELQMRYEELRIAMLELEYTEARMNAILGPLGELIGKVIAAGPGIFDRQSPRETQRQESASPSGRNPAETFRQGVRAFVDAVKGYVEATRDLMTDPSLSILSPEDQAAEAERRFMAAVAAARSGDVEAAASMVDLQRQALEAAQAAYGGGMDALGNAGYIALFQRLIAAGRTVVADPNALRLAGEAAVAKGIEESVMTQRQFMAQSHSDMQNLLLALDAVRQEMGGTVLYQPYAFTPQAKVAGAPLTAVAPYSASGGGASASDTSVRDEIRELRRELRESRRMQQINEEKVVIATEKTALNTGKSAYAVGREESRSLSR